MRKFATKTQGIIGETRVIYEFEKHGIPVSVPIGDNCPYDLVIDVNGKLFKVQVKTSADNDEAETKFNLKKTRINRGKNIVTYYSDSDIDYYALYAICKDEVYLVPFTDATHSSLTIRKKLPSNNQKKFIRLGPDYSVAKILSL